MTNKYYHGTNCKVIPKIQKEGLLAGKTNPTQVQSLNPYDMKGKRLAKFGVYLTQDLEEAYKYGYESTRDAVMELDGEYFEDEYAEADFDNICVIEIELPNYFKIGSDGYGALMTNKMDIPPNYIKKVYRRKDLRQFEDDYI